MLFRFLPGAFPAVLLLLCSCAPASVPPPAGQARDKVDTTAEVSAYRAWVLSEADAFVEATAGFCAAVIAGDREKAKALYAPSRMHFERIEPVAEALGDLDPRIDAREGDVALEEWRGYHRLEKLLWTTDNWTTAEQNEATAVAQQLSADVGLLRAQLETADITVTLMLTGAVELLNEVSSSKVTGEEERYSRTDLWDFQANIEGAEPIWRLLSPTVRSSDAELAKTIDARFSVLYGLLDGQKLGTQMAGGGFRLYNEVSSKDVLALAAAVDALAEPLAQLAQHFPSE